MRLHSNTYLSNPPICAPGFPAPIKRKKKQKLDPASIEHARQTSHSTWRVESTNIVFASEDHQTCRSVPKMEESENLYKLYGYTACVIRKIHPPKKPGSTCIFWYLRLSVTFLSARKKTQSIELGILPPKKRRPGASEGMNHQNSLQKWIHLLKFHAIFRKLQTIDLTKIAMFGFFL